MLLTRGLLLHQHPQVLGLQISCAIAGHKWFKDIKQRVDPAPLNFARGKFRHLPKMFSFWIIPAQNFPFTVLETLGRVREHNWRGPLGGNATHSPPPLREAIRGGRGGGGDGTIKAAGVCRLVLPAVRMCSPFEKGILHLWMGAGGGLPTRWVGVEEGGFRTDPARGRQPEGLPDSRGEIMFPGESCPAAHKYCFCPWRPSHAGASDAC